MEVMRMKMGEYTQSILGRKSNLGRHDIEGKDAKARRAVRASNFTQQTNVLDVDKHMCARRLFPHTE